jgi:predicted metal-dependent phosphoesterase TrpH
MKWSKIFSNRVFFRNEALAALKKDYMFIDMHSHTYVSHDSNTKISDLLKRAGKLGIGLAVTDHVQAKGAIEACRQKRVPVIPGIEILSIENKEVILYFYSPSELSDYFNNHVIKYKIIDAAPKSIIRKSLISVRCMKPMEELVEESAGYNCIRTIPHPYAYWNRSSHKLFTKNKRMLRRIEGIEVINSSLRPFMNRKATAWALKAKKAFTAGSDAHVASELGRSYVGACASTIEEFLDCVSRKENIIIGNEMKAREAFKSMIRMNHTKRNKEW